MRILLIDRNPQARSILSVRVGEALRQIGLKRSETIETDLDRLVWDKSDSVPSVAFLGPGYYQDVATSVAKFRAAFPRTPLAIVLDNDVYATAAVELRRELSARIMPIADIAQMAQFILDYDTKLQAETETGNQGIVAVCQLKGGVGATTITAALAACWAKHELSVAMLDLDDLNPQLTLWSKATSARRRIVSELLLMGEVPAFRVTELAHPIELYGGNLSVIPQPERYQESFHFKADVVESIPSSSEYIRSLIPALQSAFDVVVVDVGRSWGIATFALLPFCRHVLLVGNNDRTTLFHSFENLSRLYRESDDPEEFDLNRWQVIMNTNVIGEELAVEEIREQIEALELFPKSTRITTLAHSRQGSEWSLTEGTLYDLAEESVRGEIEELAFRLVPFRRAIRETETGMEKFRRSLNRFF